MKRDLFHILEKKNPLLALQCVVGEKKEQQARALPLPRKETEAFYCLGCGKEGWQRELLGWLDGGEWRRVYLIVDSPGLIELFTPHFLDHPRVKVGGDWESFVWEHLHKPWEIVGGNLQVEKALARAIEEAELLVALYRSFGVREMTNVLANIEEEKEAKDGAYLVGKFQEIPAIICGAGPSLEGSLQKLKEVADSALLFGGGSALAPLAAGGVSLHFAVAIDPDPPRERFLRQTYFEVPLFYQNQVDRFLLRSQHGSKLCWGAGTNFPLEGWLGKELSLRPTAVGWTVSTFATSIAVALGCNPIYFVGMDLSISEKKGYAAGVAGGAERSNPLLRTDRWGKEVATRSDFLRTKEWLEDLARSHPEITFINASTSGLPIAGVPYGDIAVSHLHLDLRSKVHREVVEAPAIRRAGFGKKLEEFEKSVQSVQKILPSYIEELLEKKNTALAAYLLEEEVFYQLHLFPNWKVWKFLLQGEEIVWAMENPAVEKKLQELLFYTELTERFIDAREV